MNMKHIIKLLFATAFAIFFLSSFAFLTGNIKYNDQDKKVKRVKIVASKDGIQQKIDTVFTDIDVGIIEEKLDSILEDMEIHLGKIEGNIFFSEDDTSYLNKLEKMEHSLSGLDSMKIKLQCVIDSLGEKVYILQGPFGHNHCMKIPPIPPLPPKGYFKGKYDRYAFDPDDKDIISYDRKELSKGREKIIIIRNKKEAENEN